MKMKRPTHAPIAASDITDEDAWQTRHHVEVTVPPPVLVPRRDLLRAGLLLPALAFGGCRQRAYGDVAPLPEGVDSAGGLRTTEEPTRFADASTYNNYYEFGTAKDQPAK